VPALDADTLRRKLAIAFYRRSRLEFSSLLLLRSSRELLDEALLLVLRLVSASVASRTNGCDPL